MSDEALQIYDVKDLSNIGNRITLAYRSILKRDPNMFEEVEWRASLAFRKVSMEEFLERLWHDPEHEAISVPSSPTIFSDKISEVSLTWPQWEDMPVIKIDRRRDSGIYLSFYGDPVSPTGYATGCREYLIELYNLGVNIKLHLTNRKMWATWAEHDLPRYLMRFIKNLQVNPIEPTIALIYATPDAMTRRSFYNIGWTYFEMTRIPIRWAIKLNYMEEVMTCSKFCAQSFAETGVESRITITPHGVRGEIFGSNNIPECIVTKDGREIELPEFVIVTNFQWDERKNPEGLVRGFLRAFKPSDDVALLMLTYWGSSSRIELMRIVQMIAKIRAELGVSDHPPIYVTNQFAPTPYHVACFYKLGKLFALPSRGEGWGLPYIECMAMGIPCIATRWSGNMDFMNDDVAFLTRVKHLEYPKKSRWNSIMEAASEGAAWALPDEDHFVSLLREAYLNPEHTRNMGAKARSHVLENFPWSRGAEAIYRRLEEI